MYYHLLRQRIIPTREIPMPGGGDGRRRCGGYQWPCEHDPADYPPDPAPIHPSDCTPEYQISLTQLYRYTYGDIIDCGTITLQTGCPSVNEGLLIPPEYELDLGRL